LRRFRTGSTAIILGLAAGEIAEDGLTRWMRGNLPAE
jgi:hypothetical protein